MSHNDEGIASLVERLPALALFERRLMQEPKCLVYCPDNGTDYCGKALDRGPGLALRRHFCLVQRWLCWQRC